MSAGEDGTSEALGEWNSGFWCGDQIGARSAGAGQSRCDGSGGAARGRVAGHTFNCLLSCFIYRQQADDFIFVMSLDSTRAVLSHDQRSHQP